MNLFQRAINTFSKNVESNLDQGSSFPVNLKKETVEGSTVFSTDKTAKEIYEAFMAGKHVYLIGCEPENNLYGRCVFQLCTCGYLKVADSYNASFFGPNFAALRLTTKMTVERIDVSCRPSASFISVSVTSNVINYDT